MMRGSNPSSASPGFTDAAPGQKNAYETYLCGTSYRSAADAFSRFARMPCEEFAGGPSFAAPLAPSSPAVRSANHFAMRSGVCTPAAALMLSVPSRTCVGARFFMVVVVSGRSVVGTPETLYYEKYQTHHCHY